VPEPIRDLPDALVLGAGGTLGEAWLRGVLNGLEAGADLDFRECEYLIGTSAGSIVAATLAGGKRPEAGDRAALEWAEAAEASSSDELPARRFGALSRGAAKAGKAVATPFAPLALATTAPAGRLARAAVLSRAPRPERTLGELGKHIEALGPRFDGRLRIAAVDRANGRRVMFGAAGAPRANVAEAVLASCAVPWIFAPVEIGGREYVDGGVWSPTNLDATPARRGIEVLCLNPTAASRPLSSVSNAAALAESLALRARGARVRTLRPDSGAAEAMGHNLMDRSRVPEALAAGYAQGLALAA
jgi:NTE family protein